MVPTSVCVDDNGRYMGVGRKDSLISLYDLRAGKIMNVSFMVIVYLVLLHYYINVVNSLAGFKLLYNIVNSFLACLQGQFIITLPQVRILAVVLSVPCLCIKRSWGLTVRE